MLLWNHWWSLEPMTKIQSLKRATIPVGLLWKTAVKHDYKKSSCTSIPCVWVRRASQLQQLGQPVTAADLETSVTSDQRFTSSQASVVAKGTHLALFHEWGGWLEKKEICWFNGIMVQCFTTIIYSFTNAAKQEVICKNKYIIIHDKFSNIFHKWRNSCAIYYQKY